MPSKTPPASQPTFQQNEPRRPVRLLDAAKPVCLLSPDETIADGNAAWWMLVGEERRQGGPLLLATCVHPDDQAAVDTWLRTVETADHTPTTIGPDCRCRFVDPSGAPHSVHLTAIARLPGHLTLVTAQLLDAPPTNWFADPAREEKHFFELADIAPALIWMSDERGESTYYNKPWRDFTGRPLGSDLGSGWLNLLHPEDRTRVAEQIEACMLARTSFQIEYRLRRADGVYRWVRDHGLPRHDTQGNFTGYVGTCFDFTEQHETEHRLALHALRQSALAAFGRMALGSRPFNELVAEAARLFTDTLSLDCSVVLARNAAGEPYTVAGTAGLLPDHMPLSVPAPALTAPAATELVLPENAAAFPLPSEWLARHRWLGGLAVAVGSEKAAYGYIVGLSHARWEPDPASLNFAHGVAHVLATVHQRELATRTLAEGEQKLVTSQKMEAVGLLAGGVAHDFNNLLTAIQCFSELLREDLAGAPAMQSKIDDILHATSRAGNLVRQLLAFSRTQVTQAEDIDLNQMLQDLHGLVRSMISDNIVLDLELAAEPAWFRADRNQIEQVVFNLCLNARDAMPQGGRLTLGIALQTLAADHARGLPAGRYVEFTVTDNGMGMPPDVQAHIFQPFFTTKPRGRGTGLGLSTCAGIAKSHGGSIRFSSTPGRGTTFYVLFPFAEPTTTFVDDVAETKPAAGSGHILAVDDDDLVRSVTTTLLETLGYKVTACAGSREALERCHENRAADIDLLLTDVVMPEINGHELARRLLELKPGLKVLFMSGYVDDPTLKKVLDNSPNNFLAKPFSTMELAEKVGLLLNHKG
ncbi:MAG TPA: ATP-binding protein [Opitutaceae bacterium]